MQKQNSEIEITRFDPMNHHIPFNRSNCRATLLKAINLIRAAQPGEAKSALYQVYRYDKIPGPFRRAHRILLGIIERLEAEAYLAEAIPADYQKLDRSLLPDPAAHDHVVILEDESQCDDDGNPRPGFRGGLILVGPTGSGKTRSGFERLKRLVRTDETRFTYVSAPRLKRTLADAAKAGKVAQVIDELLCPTCDCNHVLFIDDLSQASFTPSFAENLFELINRVTTDRHRLIVTVQIKGEPLVRKWVSEHRELRDTAEAILRRLRDYCRPVEFKCPTKPKGPAARA